MPKIVKIKLDSTQNIVANRMRIVRKSMGWSQVDLANHLKVSDKAVSSYEVGRSSPTLETIARLSKLTKRPISYFFDDQSQASQDITYKLDRIADELAGIRKYLAASQTRTQALMNSSTGSGEYDA